MKSQDRTVQDDPPEASRPDASDKSEATQDRARFFQRAEERLDASLRQAARTRDAGESPSRRGGEREGPEPGGAVEIGRIASRNWTDPRVERGQFWGGRYEPGAQGPVASGYPGREGGPQEEVTPHAARETERAWRGEIEAGVHEPEGYYAPRTGRGWGEEYRAGGITRSYERGRTTPGIAPDPQSFSPREEWARDGTYETMRRYGQSPLTGPMTSAHTVDEYSMLHRPRPWGGPPSPEEVTYSDPRHRAGEFYEGAWRAYGFRAPAEMGDVHKPGGTPERKEQSPRVQRSEAREQ